MNDPRKKAIRTEYKVDKAAAKSSKRAEMAAVKGKIPNTFEAKERMFEKGLDKSRIIKKLTRQDAKTDRVGKSARTTSVSGAASMAGSKQPAKTATSGKSGLAKSAVAPTRKAAARNEARSNPEKGSLKLYGPALSKSIPGRGTASSAEMKAKTDAIKQSKNTEGEWKRGADGSWKNDLVKKNK